MANKMTKREYFAVLKTMVEASTAENKVDMINFIDHEVELLDKKSAKSGQTPKQKENVAIKELILSTLAEIGAPSTVAEIMKNPAIVEQTISKEPLSNQRISALLTQMVKDEKTVVRTEAKKKAYFSVAE